MTEWVRPENSVPAELTLSQPSVAKDPTLALFVEGERWGWMYRDPSALRRPWTVPPPQFNPVVSETVMPRPAGINATIENVILNNPVLFYLACLGLVAFTSPFLVPLFQTSGLLGFAGLVADFFFWRWLLRMWRNRSNKSLQPQLNPRVTRENDRLKQAHAEKFARWQAAMRAHVEGEDRRVAQMVQWGAVQTLQGTIRVDVFGGTERSWEGLLTTFGSSALASNARLTLLDLSEGAVAAELWRLAGQASLVTRLVELPGQLDNVDLLGPIDGGSLVDALLETIHGEESDPSRTQRAMDDRILRGLISVIKEPITVSKLVDGLSVLLEPETQAGSTASLSVPEMQAIQSLFSIDVLSQMRERIVALEAQLHPLRLLASAGAPRFAVNLTCYILSQSGTTLVNDLIADLLPQILIRSLRSHDQFSSDVLILAGADRVRRRHLERLSDLASRRGVILVLLFRHLRDDAVQILGGDASAVVFLRLGNADEAERATRFIGKDEYFELAQLTESVSSSHTYTSGTTEQQSEGRQAGVPMYTRSETRTWGATDSLARGLEVQRGSTMSRVRRLAVEPEVLQQLPPTEFLMVELNRRVGGRRLVAGDCNPDLALVAGVSPHPFEIADSRQIFR